MSSINWSFSGDAYEAKEQSKTRVTMNCDMGEGFGMYKMGDDEGLMQIITHANIACGFHASDPVIMQKTVRLAKKYGVQVGAHPSLPDLQGFGRRAMKITPEELTAMVIYQVGALVGFLKAEGMELSHIKPHGSLYGMCSREEGLQEALSDAIEVFGVPQFGHAGTCNESVCNKRGNKLVREFYTDLDYNAEGKLIITRDHGTLEVETVAKKVKRALSEGLVESVDGVDAKVHVDSVCVHSDTEGAVEIARAVRQVIDEYNGTWI